jgi:hypothetical protein
MNYKSTIIKISLFSLTITIISINLLSELIDIVSANITGNASSPLENADC